jgi:hypothetical protein
MGRFSGEPLKNPLTGNEFIPFTDPNTGNDGSCNPSIITQFVAENMQLANGSTNGLIDPADLAKLQALPTDATLASQLGELAQVAFPIFIAAPSNGTITIYQHVLSVPWLVKEMALFVSAGSTNIQLLKNGSPINFAPSGHTSPVTTLTSTQIAGDTTPNETFNGGDTLGIALSGTTGNCANLVCSIYLAGLI